MDRLPVVSGKMLSLKLFGGTTLIGEHGPFCGPAVQRRRLALLALLAAGPSGGVSRDKLIGFLWPETDAEQARHFLADSVYALRKALGSDTILGASDTLRLNESRITSDVGQFRAASARGELETAATLHDGAFLDGFFLSNAVEFERWVEDTRAELKRTYTEALEQLARDAEKQGEHVRAAAWWARLQVADPLNSRVALHLVTALEAAGDAATALRHAKRHQELLADELGIAPDGAVNAFVERVLAARARTDATAPTGARSHPRSPRSADSLARVERPSDEPFPPSGTVAAPAAEPSMDAEVVGRWPPSRAARLSGVLALVVVGAVAAALAHQAPSSPVRERVLVTAFENRTGEAALDPLGRLAADWIARGLMQTSRLEVVSPTWTLYALPTEAMRTREAAGQLRASTAVTGAYYLEGALLRIEAQILDVDRDRLLLTLEPITVPVESSTAAVEILRQRMAAALAARFDRSSELPEITQRQQPPLYGAYVEYVEGVLLFSRFRPREASARFAKAWELDSTFHLARLYTVLVHASTGEYAHMDTVVRTLALQRERMTAFDQMLLAAFEAELAGDRAGVLRAMRRVGEMAPGSQFVVGHAVAAIAAHRPRESLAALRRLDPGTGLLSDVPRYWDWLTISRHLLGDHARELRDARTGRARHPELRSTLAHELRALAAMGRAADVDRLLEESAALGPSSSDDPVELMRLAAAELRAHGDAGAARAILNGAIAWFATLPEAERQRRRRAVAFTLYEAGRWDDARIALEELAAFEPSDVHVLGALGVLAARRGDRAGAERTSALLEDATLAGPHSRGRHTIWRARIAAQTGDTGRALRLLREAFAQGAQYGMWLHTDPDLTPLHAEQTYHELVRPRG